MHKYNLFKKNDFKLYHKLVFYYKLVIILIKLFKPRNSFIY
jgi:hypothetical protein